MTNASLSVWSAVERASRGLQFLRAVLRCAVSHGASGIWIPMHARPFLQLPARHVLHHKPRRREGDFNE